MLFGMTTSGTDQFESLLANRARIGFGVPVHPDSQDCGHDVNRSQCLSPVL